MKTFDMGQYEKAETFLLLLRWRWLFFWTSPDSRRLSFFMHKAQRFINDPAKGFSGEYRFAKSHIRIKQSPFPVFEYESAFPVFAKHF
jgi:hypothetical protein